MKKLAGLIRNQKMYDLFLKHIKNGERIIVSGRFQTKRGELYARAFLNTTDTMKDVKIDGINFMEFEVSGEVVYNADKGTFNVGATIAVPFEFEELNFTTLGYGEEFKIRTEEYTYEFTDVVS